MLYFKFVKCIKFCRKTTKKQVKFKTIKKKQLLNNVNSSKTSVTNLLTAGCYFNNDRGKTQQSLFFYKAFHFNNNFVATQYKKRILNEN